MSYALSAVDLSSFFCDIALRHWMFVDKIFDRVDGLFVRVRSPMLWPWEIRPPHCPKRLAANTQWRTSTENVFSICGSGNFCIRCRGKGFLGRRRQPIIYSRLRILRRSWWISVCRCDSLWFRRDDEPHPKGLRAASLVRMTVSPQNLIFTCCLLSGLHSRKNRLFKFGSEARTKARL